MEKKLKSELEHAKALVAAFRFHEGYGILRRFYDRLPFRQEPEHAEYIGAFTRTLMELGKEFELNFYLRELERLYERSHCAYLGFQLAVVYSDSPRRDLKSAKSLLEEVIKSGVTGDLAVKAKMRLAYCYDIVDRDLGACRAIIDSIERVEDPLLSGLLLIWKAKVMNDAGEHLSAEKIFVEVLSSVDSKADWYTWLSAQVNLATLYVDTQRASLAKKILIELQSFILEHPCKSSNLQVAALERNIQNSERPEPIKAATDGDCVTVLYSGKKLELENLTPPERLLSALLKKGNLEKSSISRMLGRLTADKKKEDSAIYNCVYSVRKLMARLGLDPGVLELSEEGYRLSVPVIWQEV